MEDNKIIRIQGRVDNDTYQYMRSDMKRVGAKTMTRYLEIVMADRRDKESVSEVLHHLRLNARETNKMVRILVELSNYTLMKAEGARDYYPSSYKPAAVFTYATTAVKQDLARLREIKLNKK